MSRVPRTLFWQIGLGLLAIQLLVVIVLGIAGLAQIREIHHQRACDELERLATVLQPTLSATSIANADDAARVAETVSAIPGLRLTVITSDGRPILDTRVEPATMDQDQRVRPEVEQALTGALGVSVRFDDRSGRQELFVARAYTDEAGRRSVLRLGQTQQGMDEDLRRLTINLVAYATGAALLTLLFAYGLAQWRTRQVASLAASAARFADGALDHRATIPPTRDLSMLAVSLNDMARLLADQLRESRAHEREVQLILQSMSNGVIAIDLQQRITTLNRAAENLLDLEVDRVRGRLVQEVIRHTELHRFINATLAGDTTSEEMELRGDATMTVQVVSEPIVDADMRPAGLLIVLNDVTQIRRLESLRSDFAANVSHELRTPITNIQGYAETLQELGSTDTEQGRRFLEIIRKNSTRLSAIVEDLMALTGLEQPDARESLEREDARIAPVLGNVVSQLAARAEAKSIDVVAEVDPHLTASINARLVEQAVSNLVGNAINYSPEDTRVDIRATSDNGTLVISVTDQGPGIPVEHHERLFERFYRVDKARSRQMGGTGLGLAIVKHIALTHGGSIRVESGPSGGSVFTMTLPVGPENPS